MSYNLTHGSSCSEPYIGPSLAQTCPGTQFLTFMTLLDTFIRAKDDISELCQRPRPVDPPEYSYDFIVVGGKRWQLLFVTIDELKKNKRVSMSVTWVNKLWNGSWQGLRIKVLTPVVELWRLSTRKRQKRKEKKNSVPRNSERERKQKRETLWMRNCWKVKRL